ncbi:o-succinylbenzoate--CoA ligase [Pullulanibacillus sp. KACC 23026]|uniref:o-succinylbenzoate--CoA ligase n=1 Tax=Pullulanibacillus sp. KACC 23026 TaxID=3028315 RepID=UPI0023AE7F12|nr:o-succinylbenzoate--CoA ligase [Pullulanibacillus sp. KACC 23026]WEG15029.1 o-succinylbenzoate--CoA ligase [Pullulanibacillus sp. KACC 23026]
MPNWLKQRAQLTPKRIAVQTENRTLTFEELEEQASRAATVLYKKGIKKGSRVALLQQNSIEMIITYHALIYLEAVTIPLNIRLTVNEWVWQLNDSEADYLLYDQDHVDKAKQVKEHQSSLLCSSIHEVRRESEKVSAYVFQDEIDLSALHTIIYTSGTTGHPKGVRLTLGNHWWSAIGSVLNLGLSEQDNWLCMVPMFHVSGLSILMKSVIYGMKMTLLHKFDSSCANKAIIQEGITHVSVVGTMLQAMLEDQEVPLNAPETLRCVLLGGGPAPLPILNKCKDRNIPVYQTYGLTETSSQIVTLSPEYMFSKLGSAGKPLFPAQIKIMKDGELLGPNQEGEILVKGPNVTEGYDHLPTATKDAFEDGWLHTGDMGRLDEEGFLYVLDRRKDMIVSGGENIYPAEVESVLMEHPDVQEAGVIGVPDERWGRVPVGFVVLREGKIFDEEQLIRFCRERLAGYKVPKQLFLMETDLPRNASRKLLRRELMTFLPKGFQED